MSQKSWQLPPLLFTFLIAVINRCHCIIIIIIRKDPEPPTKPTPTNSLELNRPPKSTSPDVPEQMIPLENYYYGTIDNYPPKTNVTLNLKCPFCKEVFNNNIILMNHLFKHAHNVSKDGQMCRYCLTSLSTANDLLKHIGKFSFYKICFFFVLWINLLFFQPRLIHPIRNMIMVSFA